MSIKAVIFDLDNTLVDFMKMKSSAVSAAARAMVGAGLNISEEDVITKLYEIYEREGIEYQTVLDCFLEQELGFLDHRLLAAGVVAYRKAREASLVLYPHVKMTLMELIRRGYKLAILSDAPARQAWLRLANLGLLHYFNTVITYEDTGKRKPDPAPYNKVLDLLKMNSDDVLMIGDWPERDILGARNLNIKTALALYGCDFDPVNSGADFELTSIDQLLATVDELNEGIHPDCSN
jgi:HAD superfamily hydrolase (TIGR02253 family)